MPQHPLTQNAGDASQVREARRKERFGRESELNDLRTLLALPEGRRTLWRLLEHCKTFSTIYEPSARIYYNAGVQDIGHFILAEINDAQPTALLQLMQEAALEEKKRNA